jgi:hypothetical protein
MARMTSEEREILTILAAAANRFAVLQSESPLTMADDGDFFCHIRAAQNVVYARVGIRDYEESKRGQ